MNMIFDSAETEMDGDAQGGQVIEAYGRGRLLIRRIDNVEQENRDSVFY
jgi:hypothetical protein